MFFRITVPKPAKKPTKILKIYTNKHLENYAQQRIKNLTAEINYRAFNSTLFNHNRVEDYKGYTVQRGRRTKNQKTGRWRGLVEIILDGTIRKIFVYPPKNSHGRNAAYGKAKDWIDENPVNNDKQ